MCSMYFVGESGSVESVYVSGLVSVNLDILHSSSVKFHCKIECF